MNRKNTLLTLLGTVVLLTAATNVLAHSLWLNPANHFPKVGDTVDIGVGWGHQYTSTRTDQEVKENTVEEITALNPDGETVKLEKASAVLYRLKVEKAGVYFVAARIKPGVFTMTPEGRKWATKKEVENPGKCTAFNIGAKTILVVGVSDKNLSGVMKQQLELVPLADPSKVKKGTSFPVKVLFEGKPLAGLPVKATYAGYGEEDAAAQKPAEKDAGKQAEKREGASEGSSDQGHKKGGVKVPVETLTDEQGQAIIPVDRPGYWMIMLSHKPPYGDPETCDEYMFNSAFTFQVK